MSPDPSDAVDPVLPDPLRFQNLEYLRRLYANVLDWYAEADAKAQLILTLDGIIITLSSSGLVLKSNPAGLTGPPRLLLTVASVLLVGSLYFAVDAMHSNLSEAALRGPDAPEPMPENAWWFGMIATHSRTEKEARHASLHDTLAVSVIRALRRTGPPQPSSREGVVTDFLSTMDADMERRALASQIVILLAHVLEKHRSVNRGWITAAGALALILGAVLFASV